MRRRVARVVLLGAVLPGVVHAVEPNSTQDTQRRKGKAKSMAVQTSPPVNMDNMLPLASREGAPTKRTDESDALNASSSVTDKGDDVLVKPHEEPDRSVQLKGVRG
jgi:hypothetical protein